MGRQHVVVVGGGAVAARKVQALLDAGARTTVISPTIVHEIETQAQAGAITLLRRPYQEGDLEGAFLVIAATDDQAINHAVWEEAKQRGCLVNVVDDPDHCNFILPAIVKRGELSVAISTGGASPALARRLREQLEDFVGPEYGILADLLAELRPALLSRFDPGEARRSAALRLIDSNILDIIERDGREAARQYAVECLSFTESAKRDVT
jgi:precorrin-2 dehydrogenase/sirohydrochlorin ferrochelatase